MDDDQIDVKEPVGEEANIETPSVPEPKATEEVETTPEDTEIKTEDEGETKTETEEGPKKGANQRIRELNAKAKSAEEKAKSLEQKLAELTGQVDQTPQTSYTPPIKADEDYTPDFKQEVLKTADALVSLKIKQSEAVNRINSEANKAVAKYSQLDPESDSFDEELSESVVEATEAYVRANPYTASPLKFVDKMMKPYLRSITKEVGKVSENLAKQVSQTAMRPTSVSTAGGKSDKEKTLAELEKELGVFN